MSPDPAPQPLPPSSDKPQQSHPQQDLEEKGVIDSGCSRHMTGNMSYLTDFEEIDEGYVAFGGNSKGGKITSKGTIKTGNLDFENVYFLTDESHVLLKIPRKNNMYSVDLKNVVPKGGLTCLFAKATSDESDLWHSRLGHINFKTMNKLVKGNLVRDDYSRFTWVFFLATKDETSGILKSFITGVENLMDQRVKVEAVNTGLHGKIGIILKPHNKDILFELFLGRKPALDFMKPFGCPVTILNTIDHLGKFDGKADEGFFIGYSINSKAFRVFNSRTRIVEENLHVQFSDNTPNIVGSGPNWLFDIDALTKSMNYKLVVAGNQSNGNVDPPFSQCSKNSQDDGSKPSSDDGKKVEEDLRKDSKSIDQEKENNVNNTINISAASTNEVNDFVAKTSIELPIDPDMPELEDIFYSEDDEDVGAEADMNNLDTFMPVSPIPTIRIHKDLPVEQIIGDLNSAQE
ncbi:ribonuclease H-like domain-containing protein [Tanacetum coccineum]